MAKSSQENRRGSKNNSIDRYKASNYSASTKSVERSPSPCSDTCAEDQSLMDSKILSTSFIEKDAIHTILEHEAGFLIRQTNAIETTNQSCRNDLNRLTQQDNKLEGSDRPRIIAIDQTTNGEDMSDCAVSPMETPKRALADDISTVYEEDNGVTPVNTKSRRGQIQELEQENQQLKDSLRQCNESLVQIQKNADLKVVRLEWDVARLRQKLADESAINSKCILLNQSMRKQLQHACENVIKNKDVSVDHQNHFIEMKNLYQREANVEKHLNKLILSRNQLARDNTALKKLLLGTCFECRQRLPVKRRDTDPPMDQETDEQQLDTNSLSLILRSEKSTTASRPTYQTSTHAVLDNLPQRPVTPSMPTSPTRKCAPGSPLGKPKKSILKNSSSHSPTKSGVRRLSSGSPQRSTTSTPTVENDSRRSARAAKTATQSDSKCVESNVESENCTNNVDGQGGGSSNSSSIQRLTPGNCFRRRSLDVVCDPKVNRRNSTGAIPESLTSNQKNARPFRQCRGSPDMKQKRLGLFWNKSPKKESPKKESPTTSSKNEPKKMRQDSCWNEDTIKSSPKRSAAGCEDQIASNISDGGGFNEPCTYIANDKLSAIRKPRKQGSDDTLLLDGSSGDNSGTKELWYDSQRIEF